MTRLARLSVVTTAPPVNDEVLAALPRPRRTRLAAALPLTLTMIGGSQILVGLYQMNAFLSGDHDHGGGATGSHLWHESAAWNLAIGAGFVWIAMQRIRPSALIPVLTAFVAVLTVVSLVDVTAGRVEPDHLLSHALIVAGYLVLLGLARPGSPSAGDPADGARPISRWRVGRPEAA